MTIINKHTREKYQTPCSIGNVSVGTTIPQCLLDDGWRLYVPAWRGPNFSHATEADDGYALIETAVDLTQEQLDQIEAERQASLAATEQASQNAAAAHEAEVAPLREQYRQITRTICQLAGVAVVDKFPTVNGVADIIMTYGTDGTNALALTQYALFLKATLDELRRMDGDDAWERI